MNLEVSLDIFAGDLLVLRDLADYFAESTDPHWGVAGITCLERVGVSVRSIM